jgi:hypothetical protein
MVESLDYRGRRMLLVEDDGGSWILSGKVQAFLNPAAATLVRRFAAGEIEPETSPDIEKMARFLERLSAPTPGPQLPPRTAAVLVIGGGPAGLTAAATAAAHLEKRAGATAPGAGSPSTGAVVLCDPEPGGLLNLVPSVTLALAPGMAFRTRPFVARLLHAAGATEVILRPHRVTSLRRVRTEAGAVFLARLDDGSEIESRAVVLATGMTGPLYQGCLRLANVFDNFLPGNLERRLGAGGAVALLGRSPGLHLAEERLVAAGYRVQVVDLSPGDEDGTLETEPTSEGGSGRLRVMRLASGLAVVADYYVFDRSYFGPRLPAEFWPGRSAGGDPRESWLRLRTGSRGQLRRPGLFACGDATPGTLGVAHALLSGQVAGQSAASFAVPESRGLSWADLPLGF